MIKVKVTIKESTTASVDTIAVSLFRFVLSYISMTTVFCVNFSWPMCIYYLLFILLWVKLPNSKAASRLLFQSSSASSFSERPFNRISKGEK